MKKILLLSSMFIIAFSNPLIAMRQAPIQPRTPSPIRQEQAFEKPPRLTTWIDDCNRLPLLQDILKNNSREQLQSYDLPAIFQENTPDRTIIPITVFTALIDQLISDFNETKNRRDWLNPLNEHNPVYVQKDTATLFKPIYFHADFHGDVKSLAKFLQDLKNQNIIDDHWRVADGNKIVFLGDYIDRGFYGLEVLYTLMILKKYNPQSVYILRGNHEDKEIYQNYNWGELQKKIHSQDTNPDVFFNKLDAFFGTLPSALYIKMPNNKFILFTHGAHNHTDIALKAFLNNPIKSFNAFTLSDDEKSLKPFNAYSWSEYATQETAITDILPSRRGAGFLYNKMPTITWMDEHNIATIIHGHSHDRTQLWGTDYHEQEHNPRGRVYGLPIAPDTIYGKTLNATDDIYGSITISNATTNRPSEIKLEKKQIIPTASAAPARA